MEEKTDLMGMDTEEIERFLESIGERPYRAGQIVKWIYRKGARSFSEMTDIGGKLKGILDERAEIGAMRILAHQVSEAGDTEKFLFGLRDGNCIESVIMSYEDHIGPSRLTACISSQVGCAMGCRFCATGMGGFTRNLTAGEIAGQVVMMQREIAPSERRIANVVLMGMGEPLMNYDNVLKAVRLMNCPEGIAIGIRHIAISTCGVIPGIDRLADEGIQTKLAVSLHSPFDETRSGMMPINRRYPIADLMKALRRYQKKTGRRVTFEYAMIDGVNDGLDSAKRLAELLRGLTSLINLIPLNNVTGNRAGRSPRGRIEAFKSYMEAAGVRTTVRKERGGDIDAACGQLRKRMAEAGER